MLIRDLKVIGNKLYEIRSQKLMSREEVAEKAGVSDRTYADIERGSVNMRVETLLKICAALHIAPNDIMTVEQPRKITEAELSEMIGKCSEMEQKTALSLLNVYLESLKK